MSFVRPAFVAFTGVDRVEILDELRSLSSRFPIEWGLLVDDEQSGNRLYPPAAVRQRLIDGAGLRWAAHVCGNAAREIVTSPATARVPLEGFQRVQVNHTRVGSTEGETRNCALFGRRSGIRTVLQCSGAFPADLRVDWLLDTSFGTGVARQEWPALPVDGPFCGFSGGLNPGNVRKALERIGAPAGSMYWIDMESGVRTDGLLDINKCRAVCEAVFG